MVQIRLLLDVVAFDLTHVMVYMEVMDKRGEYRGRDRSQTFAPSAAHLRMTLSECAIFVRALRNHDDIELTTPVLEASRQAEMAKADEEDEEWRAQNEPPGGGGPGNGTARAKAQLPPSELAAALRATMPAAAKAARPGDDEASRRSQLAPR